MVMEYVGLGVKIIANIIFTNMERVLMLMKEVEIDIRPDTVPPIIQVVMVDCWVYLLLLFLFTDVFVVMKEMIVVVIMEEVDLGLNRLATLNLTTTEKVFMVMV